MSLANKNILVGVTGGIAAYKSAELVRELVQAGAHVRVAMSEKAKAFVTPLTFQALSGHPVASDEFDAPQAEHGMDHITLARWADAILIAPASANTIAKLAQGRADDLLSTLCLASRAPIALAPAMNQAMWENPATRTNCETLKKRGLRLFGPAAGQQACGETGEGRMFEARQLQLSLSKLFHTGELDGLKVMITAGPTHEPIDPVRYIGNRSSGKMGYALAEAAHDAGATVELVSGPVALQAGESIECMRVETAQDMLDAVCQHVEHQQIFISCAAVADYRPLTRRPDKIKKLHGDLSLNLTRNPDIVAHVSQLQNRPFVVGFAAETETPQKHALQKLERKQLDMIACNNVADPQCGFDSDENALEVYWANGHCSLARDRKRKIARELIRLIAQRYASTHQPSNVTVLNQAKDRNPTAR